MDERDRPTDADAEPSDGSLVARANRGDRAAFEQLYGRYRDWILAVAYRVTDDRDLAFDSGDVTGRATWGRIGDSRRGSRDQHGTGAEECRGGATDDESCG